MLQALVVGLVTGAIYGLMALGLVLIYKGSRVLNFAQAEIGTACLYVAWLVSAKGHQPYLVGAGAAILTAVAIGLLFERFVVRRMTDAPRLSVAVGTIGLFTFLFAAEIYFFGPSPRYLPAPITGLGVQVAGIYVSPTQMVSFAVIAVIAGGLAAFLRLTDFGLGVVAAAQDAAAVRLVGIRLSRVSMFTWGVGAALSAVAALLIEPTISLIAPGVIGEPLFVGGLAAALLGGLSSLPGAFIGGLLVGVLSTEIQFVASGRAIPGVSSLVLFAIVAGVLLVRPQGLLGSANLRAESGS
ncbi:MAG TPA: branched-chain amino acid ABC transporter permease [Candidatus Solibacter sp.]|nr:branched-chain amino acid ABC transporter permease [Candidatus Solibacter sp.]